MSIIKCDLCQDQIDSDIIDCNEYNNKEVCEDCYNEAVWSEEPDYDVENYFVKQARDLEKFKR